MKSFVIIFTVSILTFTGIAGEKPILTLTPENRWAWSPDWRCKRLEQVKDRTRLTILYEPLPPERMMIQFGSELKSGLPQGKYRLEFQMKCSERYKDYPGVTLGENPWSCIAAVKIYLEPGIARKVIIPFEITEKTEKKPIRLPGLFAGDCYENTVIEYWDIQVFRQKGTPGTL